MKTLQVKLRPQAATDFLDQAAREVNLVWNWANEVCAKANSREAFEAWREKQPWYAMSKPDPDDPEDDGATHRLMNIAASEAWTASRQQAMEEAAKVCDAELENSDLARRIRSLGSKQERGHER